MSGRPQPGSELRILPVRGLEYAVQSGETLADISYKYQVDLGLLLDYNDLNDPDMIHVGSKLVVPGWFVARVAGGEVHGELAVPAS